MPRLSYAMPPLTIDRALRSDLLVVLSFTSLMALSSITVRIIPANVPEPSRLMSRVAPYPRLIVRPHQTAHPVATGDTAPTVSTHVLILSAGNAVVQIDEYDVVVVTTKATIPPPPTLSKLFPKTRSHNLPALTTTSPTLKSTLSHRSHDGLFLKYPVVGAGQSDQY